MAESHVLSGLHSKRAEIAGELDHYRKQINRLEQELGHLDGTIRVFDPDYTPVKGKKKAYRPSNSFFRPGEAQRMVLDVLRESDRPLSAKEVAEKAAEIKGLNPDERGMDSIHKSMLYSLTNQSKKGRVEQAGKKGCTILWSIAA